MRFDFLSGVGGRNRFADFIDGVGEHVAPNRLVHVVSFLVFQGTASRRDGAVSSSGVSFDIEVGDEAAGVAVWRFGFVNVDDGAELLEAQHFPGTLVVELVPAHVLDVAESEVAVFWRGRWEGLPRLVLIARAAEGDDAGHFGVLAEAGGGGGAVRCSGEDDFFPVEIVLILIEELRPLSFGIDFGEVFYEFKGAAFDAVGFGDGNFVTVIFSGGGFESHIAPAMFGDRALLAAFAEPLAGVMDLDCVDAVGIDSIHKLLFWCHEPDREAPFWIDAGIDTGVLGVLGLPLPIFENEADFWVGFDS